MAFSNLFTSLSAVEEGVSSPGPAPFTCRNKPENGKRGRKRKPQAELNGPHKKKQHYQGQTTRRYNAASFTDDDSEAIHHNVQNTDSEHASVGFTKEVIHNRRHKAAHNNTCHTVQNYKSKNNHNVNKQQQRKQPWGQRPLHQQRESWRPATRGGSHQTRPPWKKGGGDWKNIHNNRDVRESRPMFMTQEFKDQNTVLLDGRLICRHFLFGRCIKEADCKLEHVKGANDLLKEVCKFYVQGLCLKGESCPYMHKSFPCKYFHNIGRCYQGADCRFSHEPLNDITDPLLCEVLKRDSELSELRKKAEQESSGQPENTDPEIIEANKTPEPIHNTLLDPLRPTFYNSAGTNAEKETSLCQTEELTDVVEEPVLPHASYAGHPHSPPSSNPNKEELVCYSVAAVLGPQLSKPFPSFFTSPGSQESVPLTSPDRTSGSVHQSEVPYSVDAVLRSCKSVEKSTVGYTPTHPATAQSVSYTPQSVSYTPQTDLYSVNTRNEVIKSQEKTFKSLSSLQVNTGLIPKTFPGLTVPSRDYKKQDSDRPESLKPAQRLAQEVKLESLHSPVTVEEKTAPAKGSVHQPTDIACSINCKSEGVPPFGRTNHNSIFSRSPSQTSASKRPTQLKSHLSVLTLDSQASMKCQSHSRFTKTPPGLKRGTNQQDTTETTTECSSKTAHCSELAVGCKKTLKRPFHSLFASPIDDTLQPTDNSVRRSSDCESVKSEFEPAKASARSFLSLFAAPLSATPPPCMQSPPDYSKTSSRSQKSNQPVDNTPHSSRPKQRDSGLETSLPSPVRTDVKEVSHAPKSPNFSPTPKKENKDRSTEHVDQPTKQLVDPVCSLGSDSLSKTSTSPTPRGNSLSTTHAHQLPRHISSHKGSAGAATANSVLKTLFLSLSPYQEDEEQQDSIQICVPSDSRFPAQQPTGKTVAHSPEPQPSLHTPQSSLETTGGSTLSCPGISEAQVRNSGTHSLPCKPVAPPMQHLTQPRKKRTSEEGMLVNGNVGATPLKDLFKTLDTTVFH